MKIALFGASGNIGKRISAELLGRGHKVTAIVRDASKVSIEGGLRILKGDVTNAVSVAEVVKNHNVVVNSTQPKPGESSTLIVLAAQALLKGLKKAHVRRLVVVGGAASLSTGPGLRLIDSPNFPQEWKPIAQAHMDALEVYKKNKSIDWTYFSPAAVIEPGKKTEQFRIGTDTLVMDAQGNSRISMEDFAAALVDEIEHPRYIQRRFTVGY